MESKIHESEGLFRLQNTAQQFIVLWGKILLFWKIVMKTIISTISCENPVRQHPHCANTVTTKLISDGNNCLFDVPVRIIHSLSFVQLICYSCMKCVTELQS